MKKAGLVIFVVALVVCLAHAKKGEQARKAIKNDIELINHDLEQLMTVHEQTRKHSTHKTTHASSKSSSGTHVKSVKHEHSSVTQTTAKVGLSRGAKKLHPQQNAAASAHKQLEEKQKHAHKASIVQASKHHHAATAAKPQLHQKPAAKHPAPKTHAVIEEDKDENVDAEDDQDGDDVGEGEEGKVDTRSKPTTLTSGVQKFEDDDNDDNDDNNNKGEDDDEEPPSHSKAKASHKSSSKKLSKATLKAKAKAKLQHKKESKGMVQQAMAYAFGEEDQNEDKDGEDEDKDEEEDQNEDKDGEDEEEDGGVEKGLVGQAVDKLKGMFNLEEEDDE